MSGFEFHHIRSVGTLPGCMLVSQFEDGTIVAYDIKQLFQKYPVFKRLEDEAFFKKAQVDEGGHGIIWNDEIDLDANEIWHNGRRIRTKFDDLMSFSDATTIWGLNESTLRKALSYGKLVAGVDCCKYGKQWVISASAMIREYGKPKSASSISGDSFSWDNALVAEKEVEYR